MVGNMNVNITNRTSYNQIRFIINNKEYTLNKDESISVSVSDNNLIVKVLVIEKNKVLINWLFALIDGFVSEESVINSLVCNASFYIPASTTDCSVTFKDLQHRDDDNGYIYDSVYIDCNNAEITNLSYELTDTVKAHKKSLFCYIALVSGMPINIILLILMLIFKDIGFIFAGVLILLFFTIPSLKKAYKTKKYYSTEYANDVLVAKFEELKANSGNPVIPEAKGVIEKSVHKALDFIFKKK
ncbi:MAG: hypothetical protein IKK37_05295 [Clostridia bacterium]|nr:hypothetical protein [Clostridia bacterium]